MSTSNITDTEKNSIIKKPTLLMALIPIILTLGLMFLQLFIYDDFTPHIPLALGIMITGIFGWFRGYRWQQMEAGIFHVIHVAMPSVSILLAVGMIIGSWILCGTVPLLIYYGLKLISPAFFLIAAMLLCTIVSLSTGTSWGTCGTVGIALVGIGEGLGIPMHLVGGAVVSGAFFGDKMSPLSDTTNLAPAVCGTTLFAHIKNMIWTTLPAMTIALVVYWFIGLKYAGGSINTDSVLQITATIEKTFTLSPLLLLPPLVVVTLAMTRYPALPSIFTGVIAGGAMAVLVQDASVSDVFKVMQSGYVSSTGISAVDSLLTKGGMQSMMWVISLVMIALGYGGILEKTRCFEVILHSILKIVKSRFGLVASGTGFAVVTNVVSGDIYFAITLPGRVFAPAFRGKGLSTLTLSRAVEDGGTLISPLIPWNIGGAYVSGVLGIPTMVYAPFAFACWISPLIGLFHGLTGWFIPKATEQEKMDWIENKETILIDGELAECTPELVFSDKSEQKAAKEKLRIIETRKAA